MLLKGYVQRFRFSTMRLLNFEFWGFGIRGINQSINQSIIGAAYIKSDQQLTMKTHIKRYIKYLALPFLYVCALMSALLVVYSLVICRAKADKTI